jgi:hypothetical protein
MGNNAYGYHLGCRHFIRHRKRIGSADGHVTWKDVPTRTIDVGGVSFAYRELGPIPVCQ